MNKLLGSIISKFDAEAKSHMERQSLNPFSGSFSSRSPSPRLSKDQYGRPLAGSKTEERGQKAKCHILREILDLCNCIHDLGIYNKVHKPQDDSDDEEETHDDEIIITFGEIFQMYTKINDKVVGLLIAAKKRGFLFFEKEILFQRRDDDVLIALIKPISEIRAIINRELQLAASPVPPHSRNDSPVVENDTKSDKSPSPNENVEEPSKSGSGSPVENKVNGEVTETPKEFVIEKAAQTENTIEDLLVLPTENGLDDIKTITGNNDSAEIVIEGSIILPEIQSELVQQESDSNGKQEVKLLPDQIEIQSTPADIQSTLEEHSIPSVEVTCEDSYINNEDLSPKTVSEPIENPSSETIPSIEITKAPTPERSTSEEPLTHITDETKESEQKFLEMDAEVDNAEINNTEINNTKKDNVEAILNETNLTSTAINTQNSDLSLELSGINTDMSTVVSPENLQPTIKDSSLDDAVSEFDESSVLQIVDGSDSNLISGTSLNDNERKRTFSNEELIESLTAALNIRSSSPDPCDEEVEQIFQSQAAINPHFCDPLQDILVIQEPANSITAECGSSVKVCDKNIYLCVSETSDEFKTPVSEVISDLQTPEISATPEVIFSTPDNASSPLPINLTGDKSVETCDVQDTKEEIKVSQVMPLNIEPNLDSTSDTSPINITPEENTTVPLNEVPTQIKVTDNPSA